MQFTQIKETCLYTRDLKRAAEFYKTILELPQISEVEGRHVFFRAGSSVLLLFNPDVTIEDTRLPAHFGSGQIHIAFEVDKNSYITIREKILAKSVKIEHEHDWPGGYKSFYFRDPDEHLLEIVQQGMWEIK